jgi:hypothetical protein
LADKLALVVAHKQQVLVVHKQQVLGLDILAQGLEHRSHLQLD